MSAATAQIAASIETRSARMPASERADGEAGVAPQPVDADRAGPPERVGDVADRGEQRRVDHRGAGAEQHGAERPGAEPGGGGDHGDRGGLE